MDLVIAVRRELEGREERVLLRTGFCHLPEDGAHVTKNTDPDRTIAVQFRTEHQ